MQYLVMWGRLQLRPALSRCKLCDCIEHNTSVFPARLCLIRLFSLSSDVLLCNASRPVCREDVRNVSRNVRNWERLCLRCRKRRVCTVPKSCCSLVFCRTPTWGSAAPGQVEKCRPAPQSHGSSLSGRNYFITIHHQAGVNYENSTEVKFWAFC